MTVRYFQIRDDVYIKGRWHLVSPIEVRNAFQRGDQAKVVTPVRLTHSDAVPSGAPVDYIHLSGESTPVVSRRAAQILERLVPDDVQLLPALIAGVAEQYFVVNVITERRCINDSACQEVSKYTDEDRDVFPELVGGYFSVSGLKIEKSKVNNARMFRTWGWVAIIVADEIKSAFEAAHVIGARFVEV